MKLATLALDDDGTSATDDVMDSGGRAAIAEARSRHIFVILVTGRRIVDLRRVAGDLHFLDTLVAENGALPIRGRYDFGGEDSPFCSS